MTPQSLCIKLCYNEVGVGTRMPTHRHTNTLCLGIKVDLSLKVKIHDSVNEGYQKCVFTERNLFVKYNKCQQCEAAGIVSDHQRQTLSYLFREAGVGGGKWGLLKLFL